MSVPALPQAVVPKAVTLNRTVAAVAASMAARMTMQRLLPQRLLPP